MTLISLLPAAVLLARRQPSRLGSVVIRSFSLSATRFRDSISASRCYRLPTTRSRLWAWPKGSRPHVFRRSGVRACSRMTVGAAATLTSPTSERSRGLKRIRYAARNSIASCWNGPAKLASTFEKDATSPRASLHRMRQSSMSRPRRCCDHACARAGTSRCHRPRGIDRSKVQSAHRGAPARQHSNILPLHERAATGRSAARRHPTYRTQRRRLVLAHSNFKRVMSVGVVLPKLLYRRLANGSPEETLNRAISDTPIVAELMREARREWPVRVEKDFSYSASTYAGRSLDPGRGRRIVSRSCIFDRRLNCHGIRD